LLSRHVTANAPLSRRRKLKTDLHGLCPMVKGPFSTLTLLYPLSLTHTHTQTHTQTQTHTHTQTHSHSHTHTHAQVEHRGVRALYTKLLFSLTRCSRILITEELNLFAAEPRPQGGRRNSIVKGMSRIVQSRSFRSCTWYLGRARMVRLICVCAVLYCTFTIPSIHGSGRPACVCMCVCVPSPGFRT